MVLADSKGIYGIALQMIRKFSSQCAFLAVHYSIYGHGKSRVVLSEKVCHPFSVFRDRSFESNLHVTGRGRRQDCAAEQRGLVQRPSECQAPDFRLARHVYLHIEACHASFEGDLQHTAA